MCIRDRFKELELRSIPEGEVFKTITSSGTTGQRVSRIFLDGATSACQQQALCQIMSDFLGERRLPFLVLDSRQVLRNRAMFSARGAGILGSPWPGQMCRPGGSPRRTGSVTAR